MCHLRHVNTATKAMPNPVFLGWMLIKTTASTWPSPLSALRRYFCDGSPLDHPSPFPVIHFPYKQIVFVNKYLLYFGISSTSASFHWPREMRPKLFLHQSHLAGSNHWRNQFLLEEPSLCQRTVVHTFFFSMIYNFLHILTGIMLVLQLLLGLWGSKEANPHPSRMSGLTGHIPRDLPTSDAVTRVEHLW